MADQPIRVLFRYHGGVPLRQASDEAKAQSRTRLKEIFAKWKASGVKLVAYFGSYGEGVDGYATT
jgi:predicted amidophosphoribosyltransferase